jgi:hypothetical protein
VRIDHSDAEARKLRNPARERLDFAIELQEASQTRIAGPVVLDNLLSVTVGNDLREVQRCDFSCLNSPSLQVRCLQWRCAALQLYRGAVDFNCEGREIDYLQGYLEVGRWREVEVDRLIARLYVNVNELRQARARVVPAKQEGGLPAKKYSGSAAGDWNDLHGNDDSSGSAKGRSCEA